MRISGDRLGMWGFMHKISYGIMHNRFWGYALSNLPVPGYLLVHLTVPEFFWGQNLP